MLPHGSHTFSLSTQHHGAVGCAVHQAQAERPALAVDFTQVGLLRHPPNPKQGCCGVLESIKQRELRRALGSAVAGAMGGELPAAPKKATPAHSLPAVTVLGAAGPRNGECSP